MYIYTIHTNYVATAHEGLLYLAQFDDFNDS